MEHNHLRHFVHTYSHLFGIISTFTGGRVTHWDTVKHIASMMDDPFAEFQHPESRVLIIITGRYIDMLQVGEDWILTKKQAAQYACASLPTGWSLLEVS